MPKFVVIKLSQKPLFLFRCICFLIAIYFIKSAYIDFNLGEISFRGGNYDNGTSTFYAEILRQVVSALVAIYFASYGSKKRAISSDKYNKQINQDK